MGNKQKILTQLFEDCRAGNNWEFDNNDVKKIADSVGFKNLHDATKIDNSSQLPSSMKEGQGWYIIHLGKGRHRFLPDLGRGFHCFEEIPQENKYPWKYRKSLLNTLDASESTVLSVGFNQRIVHDFLYEDIVASPKLYMARRTTVTSEYKVAGKSILVNKLQMEIDMLCEHLGEITVFEAKKDFPEDFAIYQLFHPYLYYQQMIKNGELPPETSINFCYLLQKKERNASFLRIFLYKFPALDPSTIQMVKCAEYQLVER